jgi:hypothetical protein
LDFLLVFLFVETGGDIGRLRDKRGVGSGDSYRVLLIDDSRHSESLGMSLSRLSPFMYPNNDELNTL